MAAFELSQALAQSGQKTGEPGRNKTGFNGGLQLRKFYKDIRALMQRDDNEPCDIEGYRHLSWTEAIHDSLRRDAVAGPDNVRKIARQQYYNRRWGRVTYEVTVEQKERPDLRELSAEELIARTNRMIETCIDMVPPPPEPEPPEQPDAEEPER